MIRPSKIQLQGTAGRTREVLMQTFSRSKTVKPGAAASAPRISSAKKREPVHARFTGGALVFGQFARLRNPRATTMTIGRGDPAHTGDWRRRLRRISYSRWNVRADGLALMHEWGNRAAWVAAAVSALLFFYAVAYAFPNARRIALQQEREVVVACRPPPPARPSFASGAPA